MNSYYEFRMNILYYIAGWISRLLSQTLSCKQCVALCVSTTCDECYGTLISQKQRGGLIYPSRSVFKVVIMIDYYVRSNSAQLFSNVSFYKTMESTIVRSVLLDKSIFYGFHDMECSPMAMHKSLLIKTIISKFSNAQLSLLGKLKSEFKGSSHSKRSQQTILMNLKHI